MLKCKHCDKTEGVRVVVGEVTHATDQPVIVIRGQRRAIHAVCDDHKPKNYRWRRKKSFPPEVQQ